MGNSLLEVIVYGRRADMSAAKYVKNRGPGKLTLNYIPRYIKLLKEAKILETRRSPKIPPECRGEKVLSRAISLYTI